MTLRHLLSIEDLSNDDVLEIFRLADELFDIYLRRTQAQILTGKIMATLFYEPSTRTRLSFEAAMLRLGGQTISSADMRTSSSVSKGETIADSAKVISQYADVLVIRHPLAGSPRIASRHSDVPVINAGDGTHEHPTQTLCDLYTLFKERGRIRGLTVALCGDLKFGRTIHSFASALARFGANLVLIPGERLDMPDHLLRRLFIKYGQRLEPADLTPLKHPFETFDAVYMAPHRSTTASPTLDAIYLSPRAEGETSAADAVRMVKTPTGVEFTSAPARHIGGVDIVYMTRYQKERLSKDLPTHTYPKLTAAVLESPPLRRAIVMHPLPRVDEISTDVDTNPRSKYFAQVSYGVVVRMALLQFLLDSSRSGVLGADIKQPSLPGLEARRQHWSEESPSSTSPAIYKNTFGVGPKCLNDNCVSQQALEGALPEFAVLTKERTYTSHLLILECVYCAFELSVSVVGNRKSKRFGDYDPALEGFVERWLKDNSLILFTNAKEAREFGFSQFEKSPATLLMTAEEVASTIDRLANDIVAKVPDLTNLCFIGLKHRGDALAARLASRIEHIAGTKIPVGSLDVLPFRDDVHALNGPAGNVDFTIDDRIVVLVDDVLYTARTTRAAIKAIFSGLNRGRPREVRVAVLIDRGHRQLPIHPQFVGKSIPTSTMERVAVCLTEHDGRDEVSIYKIKNLDDETVRTSRAQ